MRQIFEEYGTALLYLMTACGILSMVGLIQNMITAC